MKKYNLIIFFCFFVFSLFLLAQDRFPRPEFETDYQTPNTITPIARSYVMIYIDTIIFVILMFVSGYFSFLYRSRLGIIIVSLCSVIWLGFIKHGCICSVGAIQNIALALANSGQTVSFIVLVIFILPLLASIWVGRIFCGGVCPLGAMQDLILIRPIQLPYWVCSILQFFPYIYLGLTILCAATESAFLICRFDPFVNLFRWGGSWQLTTFSFIFLGCSTFIARPYCRFVCPYSVLLRFFSAISLWHIGIAQSQCVACHLCHDICPMDAILLPHSGIPQKPQKAMRRFIIVLIVICPMIFLFGWGTSQLARLLSQIHPKVSLASAMYEYEKNNSLPTLEIKAFLAGGQTKNSLYEEVAIIQDRFYYGCWILGLFWGLVAGIKLLRSSLFRRRLLREISKTDCLNCGRCFAFCPTNKHIRANF